MALWESLLAVGLAWGLAALGKRWLRGSDLEGLGIGLVLLPVFMNLARPLDPWVMAVTVLVGLGLFILAVRRRRAKSAVEDGVNESAGRRRDRFTRPRSKA